MGVRLDSVAGDAPSARTRTLGVARIGGVVAALLIAFAPPADAQPTLARSDLAGVIFPIPGFLWIPDAARSQAAALDEASALVDRACGATEFHIWDALGAVRDEVRMRTDTAFAEAGWSLAVIDIAADGDRVYLASRGEEELVMTWLPRAEQIGLVMCVVTGPRGANAGVATIPDPILQLIPLPRPRPDPNAAIVIRPLWPEPEPEAIAPVADVVADPPAAVAEIGDAPAGGDGIGAIIAAQADDPAQPEAAIPPDPDGPGFSIWLLLLAIALGAGAYFMVRWGRDSARAMAGVGWPSTLATVIYTEIASETRPNRAGLKVTRYVPVVAYEYEVDGTMYQAARLKFGDSSQSSAAAAQQTVEKYPVGAGIEIRYDPKAPGEATVEIDPDRLELRLIGGISLAVLALAALINALG